MKQLTFSDFNGSDETDPGTQCPTCSRTGFASARGVRQHHKKVHGVRLRPGFIVDTTCAKCGVAIEVLDGNYEKTDANYCDNCRSGRVTIACDECGTGFRAKPSHADRRKYCSYTCMGAAQSRVTGSDHANWRGGASLYNTLRAFYDPSWNIAKARARKAADYTCVACGVHETERDRTHDAHHIVPILSGGTNAQSNLLVVCRSCHGRVEAFTRRFLDPILGTES